MKYIKEYNDVNFDFEEDFEEEESYDFGPYDDNLKDLNDKRSRYGHQEGFFSFHKYSSTKLVPGDMYYMDGNKRYPVCFIGAINTNFPVVCLCLDNNKYNRYRYFDFIEWVPQIQLKPMGMNIYKYMTVNDIQLKVLDAFDNIRYSSGSKNNSGNVINKFKSVYFKFLNENIEWDFDDEEISPKHKFEVMDEVVSTNGFMDVFYENKGFKRYLSDSSYYIIREVREDNGNVPYDGQMVKLVNKLSWYKTENLDLRNK